MIVGELWPPLLAGEATPCGENFASVIFPFTHNALPDVDFAVEITNQTSGSVTIQILLHREPWAHLLLTLLLVEVTVHVPLHLGVVAVSNPGQMFTGDGRTRLIVECSTDEDNFSRKMIKNSTRVGVEEKNRGSINHQGATTVAPKLLLSFKTLFLDTFYLIKAVEWTRTGTRTGSLLDPGVDQFRYLQSRDWEQLVAQSSRFRPSTVNTLSEFQEVGTSSRPSERWKSFRGLRYPGHTQLWLVRHQRHHLDMVLHTHNLWTSVPAVTGLWRHNTENTTLEKQ